MPALSPRHQLIIGLLLMLLIAATRGQHVASLVNLPGASWAAFFLAGVYLRSWRALPVLLAFVWGLDFSPHLLSGASLSEIMASGAAVCLTPAYAFLLPAYGALWMAGRWYAQRHTHTGRTLLPLAQAMVSGAVVCKLLSGGGYYLFSGHTLEPSLSGLVATLVRSFPGYLQSLAFYVGIAAIMHALWVFVAGGKSAREANRAQ